MFLSVLNKKRKNPLVLLELNIIVCLHDNLAIAQTLNG